MSRKGYRIQATTLDESRGQKGARRESLLRDWSNEVRLTSISRASMRSAGLSDTSRCTSGCRNSRPMYSCKCQGRQEGV